MSDTLRESVELKFVAADERSSLANLYQLYIHDFTDFVDQPLGDDGRFSYDPLPAYWTEPNRFAFVVRVDGRLAGFALVKKGSDFSGHPRVWDMADFFIVRGTRRRGIGYVMAETIWRQFVGEWEIRVMPSNIPALKFWSKTVSSFTGKAVTPDLATKDDEKRYLFQFESTGAAVALHE